MKEMWNQIDPARIFAGAIILLARISDLNSISESSDRRFHQYSCGCESDGKALEVDTLWVKAQNSLFSSPSTLPSR